MPSTPHSLLLYNLALELGGNHAPALLNQACLSCCLPCHDRASEHALVCSTRHQLNIRRAPVSCGTAVWHPPAVTEEDVRLSDLICQALEYVNKQGGLPVAARYLARAVALPPSNTSWYMGLSNGAAGLCKPPIPCRPLDPDCPRHCMPGGMSLVGAWPCPNQGRAELVDADRRASASLLQ